MLSRTVALPLIVAAAALKGSRLRRRGLPAPDRRAFATGTTASFASSLASQALIRVVERDRALWPYAAYRAGLAGLVLARMWRRRRRRATPYPPPSVNGSLGTPGGLSGALAADGLGGPGALAGPDGDGSAAPAAPETQKGPG